MGEDDAEALPPEPGEPLGDVERPAPVRRLDEQPARSAEAEPRKLVLRTVELGEIELSTGDHLHRRIGSANSSKRLLHLRRRRRIVVTDMRRRRENLDALPRSGRAERECLVNRPDPVVEPGQDVRVQIDQRAANARYNSRADLIPSGTYSATSRSFGECTCESGSPKPVITVGMPLSESAATSGIVPPERISAGRRPSTRSKASSPSCTARASGGTSPGGDDDQSSISSSAPSGAASRSRRSTSGMISSTFWPGARRTDTFAIASTGRPVFCKIGEPVWMPFTSIAGSA